MSRRRTPRAPLPPTLVSRRNTLAMLSSTAVLAACGGSSGGGPPAPSPSPSPTPTPTPTPPPPVSGPAWFGYGRDAQHTAVSAIASQDLGRVAWTSAVDLAPQYTAGGALLTHYGSPIVTTNNTVVIPVKTAATSGYRVEARNGANGALIWQTATDYLMPPRNWFPPYNLLLTQTGRLYAPGAGGKLLMRTDADTAGVAFAAQVFYGVAA